MTTLVLVSFYFVYKITKDYNYYNEIFFYALIVGESKSWMSLLEATRFLVKLI